jgi:hypothetical protein
MSRFKQKYWPPGIRLQVVCWYAAVFTIVLLLAGAASYHYFDNALESSVIPACIFRRGKSLKRLP